MSRTDETFMYHALQLAEQAQAAGEVPVGAVLVLDGEIIGEGFNHPISGHDPTAHAEIGALRSAASKLEQYRLLDTTMFVTLEPCPMCAGAMVHARVKRLVFGAHDPKSGAAGGIFNIAAAPELNHRLEVTGGVLGDECGGLLRSFFAKKREQS